MKQKLLMATLLALLLQGCSGGGVPGVIEQPKVSVQDVSLQSLSLTQGTALIAMNVSNPNAFPLPLRGIEYGLSLNGITVASGEQSNNSNIPARATVPVKIPVTLRLMKIAKLIPQMWRQRQVQYDLSGAVKLPFISVPFQRQGGYGVSK